MNLQQVEKRIEADDGALEVHSVFSTIQGEGPFVGRPAVFVRLAGCNLQCPLCDTDYTSNRELLSPLDLMMRVVNALRTTSRNILGRTRGLVVLTGGEPLRQRCSWFVARALANFDVQIETNGTLYDPSVEVRVGLQWKPVVVCSPKTPKLNEHLMPHIDHLKYVIRAGEVDPNDGLPTKALGCEGRPARPWPSFRGTIYVQPCDDGDIWLTGVNTKAALQSCLQFGYTLSLQTHKLLGMP